MDEQKELIQNVLFLSTNMAAMTELENHLYSMTWLIFPFLIGPEPPYNNKPANQKRP